MIVASKNSIFIILLEFQKKKVDSLIFTMPFVSKLEYEGNKQCNYSNVVKANNSLKEYSLALKSVI